MDINTIRGLATLLALIAFLALIFWAYSSKRKKDFDEAAALPFAEDSRERLDDKNNRKVEGSHNRGVADNE